MHQMMFYRSLLFLGWCIAIGLAMHAPRGQLTASSTGLTDDSIFKAKNKLGVRGGIELQVAARNNVELISVEYVRNIGRNAHSFTTNECITGLQSNEQTGLSQEEAASRLAKFGRNELLGKRQKLIWVLIVEQFQDRLVQILLGVAVVSAILATIENEAHAFTEPIVIFAILFINAIVGIIQSKSAEDSLETLKKLQPTTSTVLRSGQWISDYPVSDLVPGDVISIRVGDKVPADCRILRLKTTSVSCDEGSLTGESTTVQKSPEEVPVEAVITGKKNMVFSGTMVANGACVAIVTSTGMNTEIGAIEAGVNSASLEQMKTPLGIQLDKFGDQLTIVVGLVCLTVWLINIPKFSNPIFSSWYHGAMYYAKIAVALGVAAIPEGLPAVITLCLSLGTRRMAKRNVIVRYLPSVETLGCTSVICTDKTGTLTTNQMTVKSLLTFKPHGSDPKKTEIIERSVGGVSYEPLGEIESFGDKNMQMKGLQNLATICSICNEAVLEYKDGQYTRSGEPTEAALKVLVEKMGAPGIIKASDPFLMVRQCNDYWESQYTKLAVLEFNRDRKSMSTLCRTKSNTNSLFVKGAAEVLISRCSNLELEDGKIVNIDAELRKLLLASVKSIAARPLRCLALAYKSGASLGRQLSELKNTDEASTCKVLEQPMNFVEIEQNLVLVGLCGIKDPARPEVSAAIAKCKQAGIRIMMITGDSKETAVAIAKDVNIFELNEDTNTRAYTGKDFFALPDSVQLDLLRKGNMVFCRAEPRDKQKLITMLERLGEITAMTGDGVNDAPALKQSAIGIAMGITGTEVAKNAADMILADDNFATIVSAVEEGRAIYGNMQSFICFLISTNIGEILIIFISTIFGFPEPMTSLHLLWVNLVTDGPPATSLGFNPPDPDAMQKPPRSKISTILTKWLLARYFITGLYVCFASIGAFVWWYLDKGVSIHQLRSWGDCLNWNDFNPKLPDSMIVQSPCEIFTELRCFPQTLALSVLVIIELLKALSAVSLNTSIIKLPPWKNKWLLPGVIIPALCHLMLLYVPVLRNIFGLVPLSTRDWKVTYAIKTIPFDRHN